MSPHAGTTRDVIEVQLDLDGYPVTVIDTAGIRETDDPVEQEGVRRARTRAAEADLVLWMIDAHEHVATGACGRSAPVWVVRNKIDLDSGRVSGPGRCEGRGRGPILKISASRGDGVPELMAALVAFARDYFGVEGGWPDRPGAPEKIAAGDGAIAATQHGSWSGEGRGIGGGGATSGVAFPWATARPGRCRGYSRCDLQRILCR